MPARSLLGVRAARRAAHVLGESPRDALGELLRRGPLGETGPRREIGEARGDRVALGRPDDRDDRARRGPRDRRHAPGREERERRQRARDLALAEGADHRPLDVIAALVEERRAREELGELDRHVEGARRARPLEELEQKYLVTSVGLPTERRWHPGPRREPGPRGRPRETAPQELDRLLDHRRAVARVLDQSEERRGLDDSLGRRRRAHRRARCRRGRS